MNGLVGHGRYLSFVLPIQKECICGAISRKFHKSYVFLRQHPRKIDLIQEAPKVDSKVLQDKKKKKKTVVPIYHNMTVQALASTVNRKMEDVFDALDLSSSIYYTEKSKIQDIKTIVNAVKILGLASKIIPDPNKEAKEVVENYDIEPQNFLCVNNSFVLRTIGLIHNGKNRGAFALVSTPHVHRTKELLTQRNLDVIASPGHLRRPPPDLSVLIRRPPIVTIMGHVDHGKTTLLDALRNSNVVAKEFGGITQHIGAFSVTLPTGDTITFLDTPGHAAFSSMRARGASVTDIVILVVAADDGIMPQTEESIHHAASANVPVIVAINKIDKPEADVEATKRMLMQYSLIPEEMGGDVQCVPISALKGINLQQLQEAVITQADIMELKGDPKGYVEGRIIESRFVTGKGNVASMVIQRGTLKKGDLIIAGTGWAKVRGIFDEKGTSLQKASLSQPVEVTGWREIPSAGDQVLQAVNEKKLKQALAYRHKQIQKEKDELESEIITEKREKHNAEYKKILQKRQMMGWRKYRLTNEFRIQREVETFHQGPQLSIVVKGDVDGSVEAILGTLSGYNSQKCRLSIIDHDVGEVTLHDVELVKPFNGEIFSFNVPVSDSVKAFAKQNNVVIHEENVIYRLFEKLVESLNGKLPTIEEEEIIGEANVLEIFHINDRKLKQKLAVAGCHCVSGSLQKKHLFKVLRKEEEIYKGPINSLRHNKDEVNTIPNGKDCGLLLEDINIELKPGDQIICYSVVQLKQTIDWTPGF